MQTSKAVHKLYCNYTGVPLGHLDLTITAGHVPYMSHWNEMICYHSLFSLQRVELCTHMTREWQRLSQLIADETASELETTNLRVGFVALLHCLGSIRRDRTAIGIPTIYTVQANLESLIQLNYWQSYLASRRFHFPELHLSTLNENSTLTDIKNYLTACWGRKIQYEKQIDEVQELERSKVAERAVIAIRNTWVKPAGKKLLWQYCLGYLQGKWAVDAANWMRTIFLSTDASIIAWDLDEIKLLGDILDAQLPGGVVTYAVKERIAEIEKSWHTHYDLFTIEEDDVELINGLTAQLGGTPKPEEKDYSNKAQFFVARAKWELSNAVKDTSNKPQIDRAKQKLDDQLEGEEE